MPRDDRRRLADMQARARTSNADPGYRMQQAQRGGGGPTYAELYLYDEISYWGISAQDVVDTLRATDVDEIDLHLNSPGGDVFDGIAIYQALVDHRATVTTYVDSLAASIASVIAMAGDEIVMGPLAQMMIHDAWGMCIGNAADMRQMADELDRMSNTIASAYSGRAEGTTAQWRKAMLAETWYDANEAVAAGLADRVAEKATADDSPAARRQHDLKAYGFRYPGRQAAPGPVDAAADGGDPSSGAGDQPGASAVGEPGPAEDPQPFALPADLDLAATIRGAHEAATVVDDSVPWAEGLGDLIVGVVDHELNHRPAPADPDPVPAAPPEMDVIKLSTALKEALT